MKRLAIFSLIFSLTTVICFSQSKDVRQLEFFNAIHSGGSWDVYIQKGNTERVVIEADSGPIDKIITEVEDNTLTIKSENWSWSWGSNYKNLKIYVTFTELGKVVGSGSGTINVQSPLDSEDILIKSSGSGNINVEERVFANDDLRIENSGSSKIRILSVIEAADDTEIHNSGSGQIRINGIFSDDLSINNSGSGQIEINGGEINSQSIRLSGSGNMKMENLMSKTCEIRKSGSGSVYVSVTDELSGSSSGSGNVYVKNGKPRMDFHFSGSGKIIYQ